MPIGRRDCRGAGLGDLAHAARGEDGRRHAAGGAEGPHWAGFDALEGTPGILVREFGADEAAFEGRGP